MVTPSGIDLSVVVPAYNEQAGLRAFHDRLSAVLASVNLTVEIVYVNDGSRDRTLSVMKALQANDRRVTIVDLSRNFGKEIALTAGLDHAAGTAVVVIDADLQDPPELIPTLYAELQRGFDMVYAQRKRRAGETLVKKMTAALFYRLMNRVASVPMPVDTGDYRIIGPRALRALRQLREQHRFMKGLFTWIGFRQRAILYDRDPRLAGTTKWNYWKLWNFALEGLTSFTIAPLKIASYVGTLTAVGAFIYGIVVVIRTLIMGRDVPGYASLMVVMLFLGGAQLLAIGIIGEYLGRVFDEEKRRPLYLTQDVYRAPKFTKPQAVSSSAEPLIQDLAS